VRISGVNETVVNPHYELPDQISGWTDLSIPTDHREDGKSCIAVYTYFMDSLSGSVERITYYNSRKRVHRPAVAPGSFPRAANSRLSYDGLATVVGNLPELSPGEHLRLLGTWDTHPNHGKQFKVEVCEQALPARLREWKAISALA